MHRVRDFVFEYKTPQSWVRIGEAVQMKRVWGIKADDISIKFRKPIRGPRLNLISD